jgi:type II secretory ATPase GspE/PulE/Tfp pilus assembly ATPase PilB-like protein
MAERKKLGELLIEGGLIDQYQLKSALAHQRQWGGRLGTNIVRLDFLTEDVLVAFLSHTFRTPSINLHHVRIPPHIIAMVPKDVARKYGIIPLQQSEDKKKLIVAMSDPSNLAAVDEVQFLVNARLVPVVAADTSIEEALLHYYDQTASMRFSSSAKSSADVNLFSKPISPMPKPNSSGPAVARIEVAEDDTEIIAGEPDFEGGDEDFNADDMMVFSGGQERKISLGADRPTEPPVARAASRPAAQPAVAPAAAAPRKEAPSTDQLVMALIRTLIDKGLITKEELLAHIK